MSHPLRICGGCQTEFEPDDYRQEYCTRGCGNRSPKKRALARTRTMARQTERLNARFGLLSVRDLALFEAGHVIGYQRGYQGALRPRLQRRQEAA